MAVSEKPVIDRLNEYLGSTDVVTTVNSTVAMQCKESGTYRTRTMPIGLELMLKRVRQGVKGLIFEFEPVDERPFQVAEASDKHIFKMFPELEPIIVAGLTDKKISFNRARNGYLRDFQAEEQKKVEEEQRSTYSSNDQWGIF